VSFFLKACLSCDYIGKKDTPAYTLQIMLSHFWQKGRRVFLPKGMSFLWLHRKERHVFPMTFHQKEILGKKYTSCRWLSVCIRNGVSREWHTLSVCTQERLADDFHRKDSMTFIGKSRWLSSERQERLADDFHRQSFCRWLSSDCTQERLVVHKNVLPMTFIGKTCFPFGKKDTSCRFSFRCVFHRVNHRKERHVLPIFLFPSKSNPREKRHVFPMTLHQKEILGKTCLSLRCSHKKDTPFFPMHLSFRWKERHVFPTISHQKEILGKTCLFFRCSHKKDMPLERKTCLSFCQIWDKRIWRV